VTELEKLSGVGPMTAKRLRDAKIHSVEALAALTSVEVQDRTRIGEGMSRLIVLNARRLLGLDDVRTGYEKEQIRLQRDRLTTGLVGLDNRLLGGFEIQSVVELYGPARAGKTTVCHQLAVTAQLPLERGGLESNVFWLDIDGSFIPHLIRTIALRMGNDPDSMLDGIRVWDILHKEQLQAAMEDLPRLAIEHNAKIVIIDSLGALFRIEEDALMQVKMHHEELRKILHTLRSLARTMDILVVLTNQVFHQYSAYGGNPNAPIGGHVMAHGTTHRLYMRALRDDERQVSLKDASGIPEFEEKVVIG